MEFSYSDYLTSPRVWLIRLGATPQPRETPHRCGHWTGTHTRKTQASVKHPFVKLPTNIHEVWKMKSSSKYKVLVEYAMHQADP